MWDITSLWVICHDFLVILVRPYMTDRGHTLCFYNGLVVTQRKFWLAAELWAQNFSLDITMKVRGNTCEEITILRISWHFMIESWKKYSQMTGQSEPNHRWLNMEKEGNCSVGGWLPGRGHSEQRFKGADRLVLVGACLTGSQFLCCKGKV